MKFTDNSMLNDDYKIKGRKQSKH